MCLRVWPAGGVRAWETRSSCSLFRWLLDTGPLSPCPPAVSTCLAHRACSFCCLGAWGAHLLGSHLPGPGPVSALGPCSVASFLEGPCEARAALARACAHCGCRASSGCPFVLLPPPTPFWGGLSGPLLLVLSLAHPLMPPLVLCLPAAALGAWLGPLLAAASDVACARPSRRQPSRVWMLSREVGPRLLLSSQPR